MMVFKRCFPQLPGGHCWPQDEAGLFRSCWPLEVWPNWPPANERLKLRAPLIRNRLRLRARGSPRCGAPAFALLVGEYARSLNAER